MWSRTSTFRDYVAVLLIALISFFSVFAQATSQPLLWQVEDKNTQIRLYLFGSLHYGEEKFYPLPEVVLKAYHASDSLAVELDIDTLDSEQVRIALQRYGYYAGQENLQTHVGVQIWEQVKRISQNLGVDAQQLNQFQPWLAAMQLTNIQLARSTYQPSLGLDKYFLSESRHKKKILELETLDDQMQLFTRLSDAEQVEFLQIMLNESYKAEDSLNKLADAWYRGDEQALNELVFSSFRERELGQKLYRYIFVERNKQMLKAIDTYMENSQKIFLVVGIGHILGNDGLATLLEERGYKVTRVNPVQND